MRDSIARAFVFMHTSVKDAAEQFYQQLRRRTYVTPTSYLEACLGTWEGQTGGGWNPPQPSKRAVG